MPTHTLVLHYPSSWLVPVNPAHDDARLDTREWLSRLGVLDGPAAQRTFDFMDVGWYGGAPFPGASFAELRTITSFLTLWIFHDDVLEGLGVEAPSVLGAAVRGEPETCPEEDPLVRGWWELGRRFRASMSEAWLSRFSSRFVDWLASVDAEARLAHQKRESGRSPSFEDYLAVRCTNIGVLPVACWIEYANRREISAAMLADPDLARAEALACRIVTFQNDVAGFDKDLLGGWPNAVSSLIEDSGASVTEALDRIGRLHDADVAELQEVCERLAERHGELARGWTLSLGRMMGGFAKWHVQAPRYSSVRAESLTVQVKLGERGASTAVLRSTARAEATLSA